MKKKIQKPQQQKQSQKQLKRSEKKVEKPAQKSKISGATKSGALPTQRTKSKDFVGKVKFKLRITEAKIKKLLDFEHIEELYFFLHILNDKQIESFIKHYNNSDISKTNDIKIDKIIKNSKKSYELLDAIKAELVSRLNDEYNDLRAEISEVRKGGEDVYVEDIKSMTIPLKIKMYSSTGKKDDYYKVKKILHEIKKIVDEKKVILEKRLEEERKAKEKKEAAEKARKKKEKLPAHPPEKTEKLEKVEKDKPTSVPPTRPKGNAHSPKPEGKS